LDESLDDIRPNYTFDYTCAGSIPQSIRAFLESTDYENAIRLAISIGGDSDTIACIAGGIAAAFYKYIPDKIIEEVVKRLPKEYVELLEQFETRFNN
jgi:ADP-ribosylglycohydrolase